MKVSNGSDLIPAIPLYIAIADDDINYTYLILKKDVVNVSTDVSTLTTRVLILIKFDNSLKEINLSEVTNQPSWTNDLDGSIVAKMDIDSWVAESSGVTIGDVNILSLPSLPAGNNNIGDVDIASIAAGDNNIGNVDIVTMPAITGIVTANAGTNLNTSALALEATLQDIKTAVELIDNTVSGSELQVDIVSAPILTVQSINLDIRDLLFASDKVDVSGSTGVGVTGTFFQATQPVSAIDLDIRNLLFATDKVDVSGSSVAISGTVPVLATDLDIRNLVAASDAISIHGDVGILSQFNLANSNPASVAIVDANGDQITSFGGGTQYTEGDTDASITGIAMLMEGAGDILLPVQGTVADGLLVNLGTNNDVVVSGTVTVTDGLNIEGDVAHDTADSGNPVKIGGVAVSGSATPASVAAGDRTRFIANQHGIPYSINGHPNLITREYDFGTAAQTDVNLAAAAVAADERIYITRIEVLCDNANTVAVSARVGFGTANVPAASATGVSGMIASHPGIAPGSGIICGNGSAIIAVGGAGEEPRITTSAATTGNTHVIISYFLIDETP
jgi:hypothetical protein